MAERFKNMKGITLIELLAVLVIIGIVAAIAIPAIGGILNDASTKADIATEKHLADAAKRYMLDYESKGVQYTYQSGNLVLIDVQNELVFFGYIEEMPGAQLRNNQKYRFVEMVKLSNGNWDLAAENYYPSSDGVNRLTLVPSTATDPTQVRTGLGQAQPATAIANLPGAAFSFKATDQWHIPFLSTEPSDAKVFIVNN